MRCKSGFEKDIIRERFKKFKNNVQEGGDRKGMILMNRAMKDSEKAKTLRRKKTIVSKNQLGFMPKRRKWN